MEITKNGMTYLVSIDTEITLDNEEQIKDDIQAALTEEYDTVKLDMNDVNYMDSSGIGMLVYLNKELKKLGKTLILTAITDTVMEIIKIGAFDEILKIE